MRGFVTLAARELDHGTNDAERFSLPGHLAPFQKGVRLLFRAGAALTKPELYEYLESWDTGCAMRLPANGVL